VHKGERRLWAFCQGEAVVAFPVALGRAPEGPKERAGDQRTPEGVYHVAGPARPSRFHRFLPIDYPSVADADRALAGGRLSRRDHARVAAAHRSGELPPQDTPLGGNLGFHGEGARWRGESVGLDWTDGCIALADPDLDFLTSRLARGALVTILGTGAPLPAFEASAAP
jgi:murein L,D-transpeptidase YafK